MVNLTIGKAMEDLREEFLLRIFRNYPDHKKNWKSEEISAELSSAIYSVAIDYLIEMEKPKGVE